MRWKVVVWIQQVNNFLQLGNLDFQVFDFPVLYGKFFVFHLKLQLQFFNFRIGTKINADSICQVPQYYISFD